MGYLATKPDVQLADDMPYIYTYIDRDGAVKGTGQFNVSERMLDYLSLWEKDYSFFEQHLDATAKDMIGWIEALLPIYEENDQRKWQIAILDRVKNHLLPKLKLYPPETILAMK